VLPLKSHRQLNKWLSVPGARLRNGCVLSEEYADIYLDIPDAITKPDGDAIGLDIGYNKLAVTSDGKFYGEDFKSVISRFKRKKPGSKGKLRAKRFRAQYINRVVKSLPWNEMKMLAIEDLTGLKQDTQRKGKSSKKQRKMMAPWVYRQVLNRIEQLAQENRVRLVYVDPRNTSRRCPACGWVAKENRVAEKFQCVRCNHSADSDYVGAVNILAKATGNWQDDIVPASSEEGLGRAV
jgi:IS605 OrfB family transposase